MKIGIHGAGIAGPTLAYWLQRTGHEPTLIERAPGFRTGGYMIDFWGVGYTVAERMGLIPAILQKGYRVGEVRMVDGDGKATGGFPVEVVREMAQDRFTSLKRGDLAATICDSIAGTVETCFGDSIVDVSDRGDHVEIALASGAARSFDLLVGADGLHSPVRRLLWGPQADFERPVGYHVAAFEADGYPHRDDGVYVSHAEPGRSLSRFTLRDGRTAFLLVFTSPARSLQGGPLPEPHDDAGRRALLREVFDGSGWEAQDILAALDRAGEVYLDRVSQIQVPAWSRDRTVLIGDAAACPSLLSGEGSGLAMTAAYVLAGELYRAGGDVAAALAAYERRLRPFVEAKQKSARAFASSFTPKTALGIWLRNLATRLMVIPPVAHLLIGETMSDDFELPEYGMPTVG